MKFLCPACDRLADIATASVREGGVALGCSKCGVESTQPLSSALPAPAARSVGGESAAVVATEAVVSASAPEAAAEPEGRLVFLRALENSSPAEREDPLAVPDGYCPKCASRKRLSGPACASCGVVFSVYNAAESAPPPAILDAWKTLCQSWQDNEAHDRFLQLASTQGALAAAGRLYRVQLAYSPDDPYAARGRDEVVRRAAAVAPLETAPLGIAAPSSPLRWIGLGALFLFLLVAVTLFLRTLRGAP